MIVTHPAPGKISIWVGTFSSEDDFEDHVDDHVSPLLSLKTPISSICEVAFQEESTPLDELLDGFSGFESFIEDALRAATAQKISAANCALICYHLECQDAFDSWGELKFLGSFNVPDLA